MSATMGCKARTSMKKQAISIFERKRLGNISLRVVFAIAISDAIKKNPQWVLTNQGSELSGCIYQ
ncbi:hypothetical protein [Nostoc sp. ChiSLP03a]|uniref:hypothetical protein n=1 Tax=Nostoc sp. ChiSLP03a TaxID=3075380 RepID=UPI002AD2889F|nr:hypothetical protein [Nostoc sp. ChiSLP03a]MDZ8213526.1 hypothetical protein [Nostoc sp. ChiSLP03a]